MKNNTINHNESRSRTVIQTSVQEYAYWAGFALFIFAILAIIMPGSATALPALNLEISYGLFMNLFAMNIINKIFLLVLGFSGILSARYIYSSRNWSMTVFVTLGLLAIMGIIPATDTLFGWSPLFGNITWAYGFFSLLGAYFTFKK